MEGVRPGYVNTWAERSRQPARMAGWTEATGQAERRGWGRGLVAHQCHFPGTWRQGWIQGSCCVLRPE